MNDIAKIIRKDSFVSALMDSFPCGVFIVDEQGRAQAVNNTVERVLGIPEKDIIGKGSGEALGCINAIDNPNGCGSSQNCNSCTLRKLAERTISKNEKQKMRICLKILIKGQVRDITLMLSSVPAIIKNERFAILILVDVTKLAAFSPIETENGFRGIVGKDKKILRIFDTIRQVAYSDMPALIQGETGTGKELVAMAIHKESRRARNHFVPVNCGAIPEGVLESELFGHVKGAFTGAIRSKKGYFELADGGAIFLDEIGEMSPRTQVKLLRVLQDGKFERVGSEETIHMDVRVISATNKNLEQEVRTGRFRKDLYYRLCVIPITLPPLRERRGDIPLLVEHFLSHYTRGPEHENAILIPTALSILMAHSWPGNIRELQNVLQFALIKSGGHLIEPEHLCPPLAEVIPSSSTIMVQNRGQKLNVTNVTKALKKT
ncbi:MAG: PAS domain-containing protein, partial [Desulfobacula sp.]|nr:PAS domain-containing protein [Desulfobacula sp.]